jgi:predicted dehydrogenase
MLRIGIAGIGFMGWIHYLAYRKVEGVKLAAIQARDEKKRRGDWRGIQGNFGPPGEEVDLQGIAVHASLEELFADPNIDVVDLCLPPGIHAEATVAALEAGKHVLCEKPMALSVADCRRMTAAAKKSGKQLLIGHVLPFFPEYAWAYKAITSGTYGKLLGGNFKRVISDPTWIEDFYDPKKVGGPLLDLHVHDAHFIRLLFGMPTDVSSQGRMRGEVVEFCNTLFEFADPSLVVSATSGVLMQQGRSFTHGFEIQLEKATLLYDFAVVAGEARLLMPLTVLDAEGGAKPVELAEGDPTDAFVGEIEELAAAIKAGRPSTILDGSLAEDAVVLCQRQTQSVQTRQPVKV